MSSTAEAPQTNHSGSSRLDMSSSGLSREHHDFLMKRYGSCELDPIPSMSEKDPLNWPLRTKLLQLSMVAFHAFNTTFMAAGLIPSFAPLSESLGVSITACSYLTLGQIIVLGFFPLLWVPLMNRYGRLNLLMVSTLGCLLFNIGCIFCKTYALLMVCRLFQAFFVSPAIAVGGAVVREVTFSHQRGWWTGWWALLVTLGTNVGPFIMGFVAYHTRDTKYTFVTFAVTNFVQLCAYLILGRETVYDHEFQEQRAAQKEAEPNTARWPEPLTPYTFTVKDILRPFAFFFNHKVFLATLAYSVTFSYANVALGVELTSIYHQKFDFNPQQIGLQFIAFILGCILGEQIGGWVSDRWMAFNRRRAHYVYKSEDRLWLAYPGFLCCIVGLGVYGVCIDRIDDGKWQFTPLIGIFLASFGLQIITTILITYAIDLSPQDASEISLFITVVRQVLGFVGPFYFPVMFENLGLRTSYGILSALVVVFGLVPTLVDHIVLKDKRGTSHVI